MRGKKKSPVGFEPANDTTHRLSPRGRIARIIISIANLDFDDLTGCARACALAPPISPRSN